MGDKPGDGIDLRHGSIFVVLALHGQYRAANGVEFWNWQQDLNIPGLRKLKMSYKPIGFLKKFFVMRHGKFRT